MEEAIEILWSYARREPLDSNGETIVPTVNNSIAAIRILSRLEGWEKENREERKMKPSEYMELGYVGEKRSGISEERKVKPSEYIELGYVGEERNTASPQDSLSVFPPSRERETLLSFTRSTLPTFTPAPFHEVKEKRGEK